MKRAIYVDYENVNISGLQAIEKLGSEDIVKIFIGAQTSKLSMQDANRIFNCGAQVELITNQYIGKNALDFIIMVHMGHDIAKELAKSYYIVSKDKGYDPAIHEMRRISSFTIERKPDINEVIGEKKSVGKRILSFFKSDKEADESDKTEHHVIKGSSDKKIKSKIETELVQSDEELEEKRRKARNSRNNNRRRNNRNGMHRLGVKNVPEVSEKADETSLQTKPNNTKAAVKKTETEPQEAPVASADVKAEETITKKRHRRRTRHHKKDENLATGENLEVVETKKADSVETPTEENQTVTDSQNSKKSYEKKSSDRKRFEKKTFNKKKTDKKNTEIKDSKQDENENTSPVNETVENGDKEEKPAEKRNRRRYPNRRNKAHSDKNAVDKESAEVTKNTQKAQENKESTKVEHKKTPEEIEREKARAEAYALLQSLNDD